MIVVPDLEYQKALKFCKDIQNHTILPFETNIIDFSNAKNCDPFPMLLASTAIRRLISENQGIEFQKVNCNNTYADYMRLYSACEIENDSLVSTIKYKNTYICITKWDVSELRKESSQNIERIQETVENRAKSMAKILAQNNTNFANWLVFVLREIIRNIPEHSNADAIWYCAQYWPKYDLVELAILDEGIGITNSLRSNVSFEDSITNDYEALKLSIQPGISRTFTPGKNKPSNDEWKNSGFGLYMVSQLCIELGGSFIIASGKDSICMRKSIDGSIVESRFDTDIKGTAIQIRIRPSRINDYKKISNDILRRGESLVKHNSNAIQSASKSTKSILFDDDLF